MDECLCKKAAAHARLWLTVGGLFWCTAVLSVGCGEPGAPQPPSLNLAVPARSVTALRVGNTVHLTWTTLNRTTDHIETTGPMRVRICRMEGSGPCETIEDQPVKLGAPGSYDDVLPADALQGDAKLLTYYIEILNHGRKSAGRSEAGYAIGGAGVPQVSDIRVTQRPEGVELYWKPLAWPENANSARIVRIVRTREKTAPLEGKKVNKGLLATPEEAPVQNLEVVVSPAGSYQTGGRALDRTARKGETYSYVLQGVERVDVAGKALEMAGSKSGALVVETRDTFPPGVPQDLSVVADTSERVIDLSWSPDTDTDLAGYFVYRRDAGAGQENSKISGSDPVQTPVFHDTHADPDRKYAYSVSAVDTAGNESQRSKEAIETLASHP